jgi:hypothetical protein
MSQPSSEQKSSGQSRETAPGKSTISASFVKDCAVLVDGHHDVLSPVICVSTCQPHTAYLDAPVHQH